MKEAKPRPERSWRPLAAAAVVVALGFAAVFFYFLRERSQLPPAAGSVAVVPFSARGSTGADDPLGLGMAEALSRRLAALQQLAVPSTTRVMRIVERTRDPLLAGRALGVDAVLTGAFERDGRRLTITAQLARVQDGRLLWQGRHDATFAEVFRVQDEIAGHVAKSLLTDVAAADRDRLSRHATDDSAAYELYLQGRKAWRNRTPKSIRAAIEHFESAIAKDPKFALAHAGLADAYSLTASGLSPRDRFPKAREASLRALELDEGLAEAHTSLAFVSYKFAWDFAASEKAFRRALELQPSYAQTHHWFGEFLSVIGRHDEALAKLQRALELEPESVAVRVDQCWSLNRARRYEEAIARCRQVQALEPNEWRAERGLASASRGLKRERDAVEHFLRAELLLGTPQSRVDVMRATCEAEGLAGYWKERIKLLLEQRRDAATMPYSSAAGLAWSYAALGEREQALKWLSASFEVRDDGPLMLGEPAFDSVRADPRFQELTRRVGGLGAQSW